MAALDLDAYFARIGYDGPRAPTLAVLTETHRRHLAAIPFEAIEARLGRVVDVSPQGVDAKLINARRGGYCYEQNGLLKRALEALGFRVDALLARVTMHGGPDTPRPGRTHMTLSVEAEGGRYLVDAGFGALVPAAPLRLDARGPQQTRLGTFRLAPDGREIALSIAEGDGWAPLYSASLEPQAQADVEIANWFTSTHPQSFFRRAFAVARVAETERYALFDDRLTVRRADGSEERRRLTAPEIEAALPELFRLAPQPEWRDLFAQATAAAA
ncbi:arylamine N-acetyltransferase [Methylopila jiangsuensis]|uniref:Arylamine N-acetyltransferase n=1 Tax=Methylopila jiangsuensis TaxID=586230 RepID=A0A9W6N4Y8_9HYPH|nr:arylamine N-acetyltransferase [Methylopila jiangsuensis]MDR6284777.1 N-hydroxyarylamine O-acetyltransferase [Methylopila jiangsuensis]GLK77833.1 arylamine N-acetyltransferase [Methylopila jiangsuensis]